VLSINLDIGDVVLENSWDVDLCAKTISMQLHHMYVSAFRVLWSYREIVDAVSSRPRKVAGLAKSQRIVGILTSGKVPLEKTLQYS
jgi:hypothetical protein